VGTMHRSFRTGDEGTVGGGTTHHTNHAPSSGDTAQVSGKIVEPNATNPFHHLGLPGIYSGGWYL